MDETTRISAGLAAPEGYDARAGEPVFGSLRCRATALAMGFQIGGVKKAGVGITRSGFVLSTSTKISETSSVSRGPPR